MSGKVFWDIQLIIQIIFIIQLINLNIDKKKNVLIVSMFLFLYNCVLMLNFYSQLRINILIHILNLFSIFFLYRENPQKAVVSFSFAYTLVLIFDFIQNNKVFLEIVEFIMGRDDLKKNNDAINLIFFVIFMLLTKKCYIYIKELIYLINENFISSFSIIIIGFFMDIIMINEVSKNTSLNTVILVNKIMIINICIFILAVVYTTIKLDNQLNRFSELNNAMEIKNGELRKIKHDYGAQISYLYGLFLLKRYDNLGKALKDICRKNDEISSAVSIRNNENSIIYKALKPALEHGIHILLEENIDSSLININEDDLFYILTVITNIALKYMDNEGIIIVKVYEAFQNAVIDIENSRMHKKKKKFVDMIRDFYLNFDEGWEEFFSLNEIKKIIENNNGEIHIKNKNISTSVIISIPTKMNFREELQ